MEINEKLPSSFEWYKNQIAGHNPSVIRNGLRQIGNYFFKQIFTF